MRDTALGVQRAVDGVDDHAHEIVTVVDLSPLLREGGEAEALSAQRVELVEDEILGRMVDDQRAIAAAASTPGLPRPFCGARRVGEHLLQAGHRASTDPQPICIKSRADGRHLKPILSDVTLTLDELLPVQHQAVTYPGRSLVITGAAGTGKTAAIEARFLWLCARGVAPERLAVVVPTPARARALEARLESAL